MEKQKTFHLKKKEAILFGLLFLAACAACGYLMWNRQNKDCGSIVISVYGEEYGTYSLGKDQEIPINETNICTISNGTCSMTDANCEDQVCMFMYPIDDQGGMIICLPNGVVIEGIPAESKKKE